MGSIYLCVYGRLTADPQLSENRCTFTIAADSCRMDSQTHRPIAEFLRVTVWGKRAETAATYLHKGDAVFVTGDYYTETYVGRDNQNHFQANIGNANWSFGERRHSSTQENDDELPD